MDPLYLIIVGGAISFAITVWRRTVRCPKCKLAMEQIAFKDPFKKNVTPNFAIGPMIRGIPRRVKYTYMCPECKKKVTRTRREWR